MKTTLFVLFVALFLTGCGDSSNPSSGVDMTNTAPKKDAIETAVDWSKLQDRSGVAYIPNTDKPYSGWAKQNYDNEQVKVLAEFTDGSVTRLKHWQQNGIPKWDIGYSKGKVSLSDVPLEVRDSDSSLQHGYYAEWHENGQKKHEANWKDGKRDGLETHWYENGQKKSETNHKDDKKDGLETRWYENGQKEWEGNYKDGKVVGLYTWWYENGQNSQEVNHKDGKIDGLAAKWYEFGQKKSEAHFKDSKMMSVEVWKPNGEKCTETNLKDGNGVLVGYRLRKIRIDPSLSENWVIRRYTFKDGELVED